MDDPIGELVMLLARLPGIGERTATRLAHHVLVRDDVALGIDDESRAEPRHLVAPGREELAEEGLEPLIVGLRVHHPGAEGGDRDHPGSRALGRLHDRRPPPGIDRRLGREETRGEREPEADRGHGPPPHPIAHSRRHF